MGDASERVLKHLAKAKATNQIINMSNAAHDAHVAILRARKVLDEMESKNPQITEMKQYASVIKALNEAQPLALRLSKLADKASDEVKYLDFFPYLR